MAATKYTYSVSGDFPNQAVDPGRFEREIDQSSIVTALSYIQVNGDVCDVWFVDPLSTSDETTLDGLVATHTGAPMPDAVRYITTVVPTVDDDDTWGFQIGSLWINTVSEIVYRCTDTTEGEAAWVKDADILGTTELYNEPIDPAVPTDGEMLTWDAGEGEWSAEPLVAHATSHEPTGDDTVPNLFHDNVAGEIDALTAKGTPADGDLVLIEDSATGLTKKKMTLENLLTGSLNYANQVLITGTTTSTATSYTLISGLTVTPTAGTYLVSLSGSIWSSVKARVMYLAIFVGGVEVTGSERQYSPGESSQPTPFALPLAIAVTVDGAQAVEARWYITSGNPTATMSINNRNLTLFKVV